MIGSNKLFGSDISLLGLHRLYRKKDMFSDDGHQTQITYKQNGTAKCLRKMIICTSIISLFYFAQGSLLKFIRSYNPKVR